MLGSPKGLYSLRQNTLCLKLEDRQPRACFKGAIYLAKERPVRPESYGLAEGKASRYAPLGRNGLGTYEDQQSSPTLEQGARGEAGKMGRRRREGLTP